MDFGSQFPCKSSLQHHPVCMGVRSQPPGRTGRGGEPCGPLARVTSLSAHVHPSASRGASHRCTGPPRLRRGGKTLGNAANSGTSRPAATLKQGFRWWRRQGGGIPPSTAAQEILLLLGTSWGAPSTPRPCPTRSGPMARGEGMLGAPCPGSHTWGRGRCLGQRRCFPKGFWAQRLLLKAA